MQWFNLHTLCDLSRKNVPNGSRFMQKRALLAFRFLTEFRLEAVWKPFERRKKSSASWAKHTVIKEAWKSPTEANFLN